MNATDPPPAPAGGPAPSSFAAAAEALAAIENAVRLAQAPSADGSESSVSATATSHDALAALLLLRELRADLAGWEAGLIEAARRAGASWAELAHPLGVASRQAAERRYLRVRPGAAGSTGEERVQATRDRRAADRSVSAWARGNAADLRRLAGQILSLPDLPSAVRDPLGEALGEDDAAALLIPLAGTLGGLEPGHPVLAARVAALIDATASLRDARTGGAPPS